MILPTPSQAVALYVAPLFGLTAIVLALFSLLAPTLLLHDRVALLTVLPSTSLRPNSTGSVDGPSIFMGVLGSCSRAKNGGSIGCTSAALSPVYDITVLPDNALGRLLSAPVVSTAAFIAIAVTFMILFFIIYTFTAFSHKMSPKIGRMFTNPLFQRISSLLGVFAFIVGLASFVIIRVWFSKAVLDFNTNIIDQGEQGPELIAGLGNAFIMAWIAYGFFAVPVICSLTKLHVRAAVGKSGV